MLRSHLIERLNAGLQRRLTLISAVTESLKPEYGMLQLLFSSFVGDKRAKMHLSNPNEKDIDFLRELLEAEKTKPVIEQAYTLDQIAEAHRHVENGHTKGKIVIEVQKSS